MNQFWKPGTDRIRSEEDFLLLNERHKRLPIDQQRKLLPIHRFKNDILFAIENYSTVIIVGDTGTGKSTQITQYLHDIGWAAHGQSICCTQPRRIAVTTVAGRVAQEMGCILGEEVGYGIRFDSKFTPRTAIKYCTDGILLRETLSDPLLMAYSVIMIDEAHERSLESDILLGLIKKIKRKRLDLKVIITSATLNATLLKDFFETNPSLHTSSPNPNEDTACVVSIQGRLHPIDILYLEKPVSNYIKSSVETAMKIHKHEGEGDILIFLAGGEEIDMAVEMIRDQIDEAAESDARRPGTSPSLLSNLIVCPLYSSLPHSMQAQVFFPTPPGRRKIVVATNIAETSVTIEGLRFVIDSGFVKLNYFDVRSGVDALITCPVSKASATQRAGRAGRVEPGKCFRLMTEEDFQSLPDSSPPQMQRTDISWAVLQLKSLGIDDILHFDFLSSPPPETMIHALELLFSLGALNSDGKLTRIGEQMAEMPVEPRLSRSLLASIEMGCSEEMLTVAAMLSVESPFISQRAKASIESKKHWLECMGEFVTLEGGDQLTLLKIYREYELHGFDASWCDSMCLQSRVLARAREVRSQLARCLLAFLPSTSSSSSSDSSTETPIHFSSHSRKRSITSSSSSSTSSSPFISCEEDMDTLKKCIVSGYFAHAARLSHDGHYMTLRGNIRVNPHSTSIFARFGSSQPPEWVVYSEVIHAKDTEMREIIPIDPLWLMDVAEHYYDLRIRR